MFMRVLCGHVNHSQNIIQKDDEQNEVDNSIAQTEW